MPINGKNTHTKEEIIQCQQKYKKWRIYIFGIYLTY